METLGRGELVRGAEKLSYLSCTPGHSILVLISLTWRGNSLTNAKGNKWASMTQRKEAPVRLEHPAGDEHIIFSTFHS